MNAIRPGALTYWRNQASVVLELKGLTEAVIRTTADNSTHVVRATELSTTPVSSGDTGNVAATSGVAARCYKAAFQAMGR